MKTHTLGILALFSILAFGFNAQAREARSMNVNFSSHYSYYSCDYAEDLTEDHLEDLGAQDIKVRCSGGLPDFWFVNVRATFTVATPQDEGASYQSVKIKTRESCDLNETILREAFRYVDSQNFKRQGSCWDSQGHLNYSADVLM